MTMSTTGIAAKSKFGNGHPADYRRVYVWEMPVRAYHWINAIVLVVLCITGYLIGASPQDVDNLVAEALEEIERQTLADVLIIEDEPIIAMDIETIVRDLGHNVTGVAVTRDEAVAQARQNPPGLVLADIQLADDSSGIDAVKDILAEFSVPVIFITAFPERLLTGTRPEPTFLITKPFQRSTVKAAIAQALFFDAATVPAA